MDFSHFDKAEEKLDSFATYIRELKDENRELARNIYSLELGIKKKLPSKGGFGELKDKHSDLIEERDRLVMEREFLRKKVETMIGRLDDAIAKENSGG